MYISYVIVSQCKYTYDSSGKLIEVYDVKSGEGLQYTYDDNRVVEAQQYSSAAGVAGQKITFNYGDDYTEIQSSGGDDVFGTNDDIISAYVFDDYC